MNYFSLHTRIISILGLFLCYSAHVQGEEGTGQAEDANESLLDQRLRMLYAGNPVSTEDSYQIINRARMAPHSVLIFKRTAYDRVDHLSDRVEARSPSADWQDDFAQFVGLTQSITKLFLSNGISQDDINSLELTKLWKVTDNPKTLIFNLYLEKEPPDEELRKLGYIKNITFLTAIAVYLEKGWSIQILNEQYNGLTDVEKGPVTYRVWDVSDFDGDDENEIVLNIDGYESKHLEVLSKTKNNRYEVIYSGGGYGL